MKHNLKTRTSVGIIGMPRSGTTIVTSFINSLDRATIWGEAHRDIGMPRIMNTRHGTGMLKPVGNILGQIEEFAIEHDLLIYGTKDVLDSLVTDPCATYRSYGNRYEHVYVIFRNPRRVWASMKALGNAERLRMPEREFIWKYKQFVNYCIRMKNATPIILERFRQDPIGYMSTQMDLEISGPLILEQYTGGGDVHAMTDKEIRPKTKRIPDPGPKLDKAAAAYMEVYRL